MKRLVSVSAFELFITWPSFSYILNSHNYNINCRIIDENLGLLVDKYLLELEGEAEDIQMFLDYLKYSGFKIK